MLQLLVGQTVISAFLNHAPGPKNPNYVIHTNLSPATLALSKNIALRIFPFFKIKNSPQIHRVKYLQSILL